MRIASEANNLFYRALLPLLLGSAFALAAAASSATPLHCFEGCTEGSNCHAFAKCEDGFCWPTTENINCKGLWGPGDEIDS